MTRDELITIALRTVGDTSLTSEAADALDMILYELESVTNWRFLEANTTYQTENGVDSVAFSASKWPSAALTNYSKGMVIKSTIDPYLLTPISFGAQLAKNDAQTGAPQEFALWKESLYLTPVPTASALPLLTIYYYKNITLPTSGSDVIETVVGVPSKYLPFIITGVIYKLTTEEDDNRDFKTIWQNSLTLMAQDNFLYYGGVIENG